MRKRSMRREILLVGEMIDAAEQARAHRRRQPRSPGGRSATQRCSALELHRHRRGSHPTWPRDPEPVSRRRLGQTRAVAQPHRARLLVHRSRDPSHDRDRRSPPLHRTAAASPERGGARAGERVGRVSPEGLPYAGCAPATPFSITNDARVRTGAPGVVTTSTTRKSAVQPAGVTTLRTYPRLRLMNLMCGFSDSCTESLGFWSAPLPPVLIDVPTSSVATSPSRGRRSRP